MKSIVLFLVCLSIILSIAISFDLMLITDHSERTFNMSVISILSFSVCLMPVVSCWYWKWLPVHWPRICWDPLWETKTPKVSLYDAQLSVDYSLMYVLFAGLLYFRSRWQLSDGLERKSSIRWRETLSAQSGGCEYLCLHSIILQSSILI